MTVHYLLNCYSSRIMVKQEEGDEGAFHVNIQSNANPLSFGNTLYTARSKEQAIRIADQLCAFYAMAKVNGYYLDGKWFRQENRSDISAEHVLMKERTTEEMHALLASAQ
ncbi:hypothetical protein [Paenibacillus silvisoli]|uniref:hypothetical protein n=1 Tax=Paenibacillus silvisoli TaxID=3110539 RepID=UPI002803DE75|nr:hypothetical protein [Paenibacillus silvisoli]